MSYSEKLKDPKWQQKRLKIFERDKWTCVSCDRSDLTLHVHHMFYLPGVEPWDYKDEHLITYCEHCHNSEHLIGNQIQESLIEIVRRNRLLIKPVSQLCVLAEKYPPFPGMLKDFLNKSMSSYLRTKTEESTYAKQNAERLD
jgi:hypothetical protein